MLIRYARQTLLLSQYLQPIKPPAKLSTSRMMEAWTRAALQTMKVSNQATEAPMRVGNPEAARMRARMTVTVETQKAVIMRMTSTTLD